MKKNDIIFRNKLIGFGFNQLKMEINYGSFKASVNGDSFDFIVLKSKKANKNCTYSVLYHGKNFICLQPLSWINYNRESPFIIIVNPESKMKLFSGRLKESTIDSTEVHKYLVYARTKSIALRKMHDLAMTWYTPFDGYNKKGKFYSYCNGEHKVTIKIVGEITKEVFIERFLRKYTL